MALAGLHARLKPSLDRLSRFVNLRLAICRDAPGGCTACTSLVRRYRHGERRSHPEHVVSAAGVEPQTRRLAGSTQPYYLTLCTRYWQDGHAAVTAVASLSDPTDFTGGFYLSNLSQRALLPMQLGDAIIHASDLFHGVEVREGERWSLVVWFRTCPRCSLAGSTHWYEQRAEAGESFAQFLHARRLAHSHRREPRRLVIATTWLNRSAYVPQGSNPSLAAQQTRPGVWRVVQAALNLWLPRPSSLVWRMTRPNLLAGNLVSPQRCTSSVERMRRARVLSSACVPQCSGCTAPRTGMRALLAAEAAVEVEAEAVAEAVVGMTTVPCAWARKRPPAPLRFPHKLH